MSGDYALGFGGGDPDDSFLVRVGGMTVLSLGPDPLHDPDPLNFPFAPFSTTFTATAASLDIEFVGQANGGDHDYFVDNLVVVPEPGTAGLSLFGAVLGLALRRHARR